MEQTSITNYSPSFTTTQTSLHEYKSDSVNLDELFLNGNIIKAVSTPTSRKKCFDGHKVLIVDVSSSGFELTGIR